MTWRKHARSAWHNLPAGMRRLLIGVLIASAGLILLSFAGPHDVQVAAVLGLLGLLVLVQIAVLWTLWQQSPAVRQARRAYLAGHYEAAIEVLEAASEEGKIDPAGRTLLGNAYRQVGRLDDSERVLRAVYEAEPGVPFAAYGLGRTLLVQGRYAGAVKLIEEALRNRGTPVIAADLGYARYLAGMPDAAAEALAEAERWDLEPHRALMTQYLRWRLGGGMADDALRKRLARDDHGLDIWKAERERFRDTPYGAVLAQDIARIEELLRGEQS